MKNTLLLLAMSLILQAQAQTTLSLTSRGDLASVIGFSTTDSFFASEETKKIGTRASFGLELARKISENQSVLYGIEYAISGFDYENDLIGIDTEVKALGAYRYDFFALPLGYRWYKSIKKWKVFAQGTILPMAYLRTIQSTRIVEVGGIDTGRETSSARNQDFQSFHLAASTAVGLQRSIFSNWVIGLQPTFRIHVMSVATSEFPERPWTAGLQLNLGRKLGSNTRNN